MINRWTREAGNYGTHGSGSKTRFFSLAGLSFTRVAELVVDCSLAFTLCSAGFKAAVEVVGASWTCADNPAAKSIAEQNNGM